MHIRLLQPLNLLINGYYVANIEFINNQKIFMKHGTEAVECLVKVAVWKPERFLVQFFVDGQEFRVIVPMSAILFYRKVS